jgi:hypothetical protein
VTREDAKNDLPPISYLIELRLRALSVAQEPDVMVHPDEDTITAFVESRLGAEESNPVVTHLISCGACRRMTAQLARLQTELDESEDVAYEEPSGRLEAFLGGLASRLAPSEGDVVFAYQNPEEAVDFASSLEDASSETEEDEGSETKEDEGKNS